MTSLPKLGWAAAIVAFLSAGSVALGAFVSGPIILLPAALIPLSAGIGVLRRKVWSAYGYALWGGAQLAWLPVVLARGRTDAAGKASAVVALLVSALLVILFICAGRSLARAGGQRGHAYPWIMLAALQALPFFFFEAFVFPTGSMENTLLVGDRIIARIFPRPAPVRGELVVLAYPVDHRQTFVKRMVGMPGDRVRFAHKALYRNGARLDEPYAVHKLDYEDLYRDNFPTTPNTPLYPQAQEMLSKNVVNGEVVVPPGKYFVLGDNRDLSLDSRYWGFVSDAELIGKPGLIYDSKEETTEEATQTNSLRPHRTRWSRLFQVPR